MFTLPLAFLLKIHSDQGGSSQIVPVEVLTRRCVIIRFTVIPNKPNESGKKTHMTEKPHPTEIFKISTDLRL